MFLTFGLRDGTIILGKILRVVIFGKVTWRDKVRTAYIDRREMGHLLAALTPPNRLALEISMATGLRIGDVLNLKSDQLTQRFFIRELKTGKTRRIYLPGELLDRAKRMAGKIYVFENRLDYRKHRTRQAVFKDLKRVSKAFGVHDNIAPHSARKVYAVEAYKRSGGDLKKVQRLLNHESEAVTMIYAMSDQLCKRHKLVK